MWGLGTMKYTKAKTLKRRKEHEAAFSGIEPVRYRKMKPTAMQNIMGMVMGGVAAGAGSIALGSMGGAAAGNASTGILNLSSTYPTVGTLGGTGTVLGGVSDMYKPFASKRRRRR